MKKIMMMAAVAFAACSLHAASATWNVGVALFDSNWGPAQGALMLATGTDSWSFAFDSTSGSANGTITGDTTGIFAEGTEWSATVTTELFDMEGNSKGMYSKVFDFSMPTLPADAPSQASAFEVLNGEIGMAFADVTYGTLPYYENAAAQGWTAAVPEPTSGLLLLLGVAGLALRRKQA